LKSEHLAKLEIARLRQELDVLKSKQQVKPKLQYAPAPLDQPKPVKKSKPVKRAVYPQPKSLDHLYAFNDTNYTRTVPPKRNIMPLHE
jgi:hypothetical protein